MGFWGLDSCHEHSTSNHKPILWKVWKVIRNEWRHSGTDTKLKRIRQYCGRRNLISWPQKISIHNKLNIPVTKLKRLLSAASDKSSYVLAVIVVVALFVRFYDRVLVEYYPDIMIILAAKSLINGYGYPYSYIGPPGPAFFFAPFAYFMNVVDAAQVVIGFFGASLSIVCFLICKILLKDKTAGLVGALIIAFDPFFVYISRVLWIDSINGFLVLVSILLFPIVVVRNRVILYVGFSGLLLLTLLFKTYNAVVLPALIVWAILELRTRIFSLIRALTATVAIPFLGLLMYLYFSPIEAYRVRSGARGSVLPIIGLKIATLSDTFKSLTSFSFWALSPNPPVELSGQGYVSNSMLLELGLVFLPFIFVGFLMVWRHGDRKLMLSLVTVIALTVAIFTSFGGFHPRFLLSSRVVMISLFALGGTRAVRWLIK